MSERASSFAGSTLDSCDESNKTKSTPCSVDAGVTGPASLLGDGL